MVRETAPLITVTEDSDRAWLCQGTFKAKNMHHTHTIVCICWELRRQFRV